MIYPQLELDLGSKPHRVPLGHMADATSSHDGLYICVQTVGCQNFCTWTFTVMTQTDFNCHVCDDDTATTDDIPGHENSEHGDSEATPRPRL